MPRQPRFNQLLIGWRQRRIVRFKGPPNRNLTLLKVKPWKLLDDFIKTHRQSLTARREFFK